MIDSSASWPRLNTHVDGVLGCMRRSWVRVPLCDRPKASSRKQVVGWIKRLEALFEAGLPTEHCFPAFILNLNLL